MRDLFCEEILFNIKNNACTCMIALNVQFFISFWNVGFSLHNDFEPLLIVNAHVGIFIQK